MNVIILSDGIRGHFHQSLGVSKWLERLGDFKLDKIIEVPKFSGFKKFWLFKILARKLKNSRDKNFALSWLKRTGLKIPDLRQNSTLFISTGSTAAPYNLALARATGNKCAVIMTPSILGITPFDFAIVPEHDNPQNNSHVIKTLGAPNHIYIPDLKSAADEKFGNIRAQKVLAILIGGNDANYKITPEWVNEILKPLANLRDTAILITTSRRTGVEADLAIKNIFADKAEFLLLASENPNENPIPAMLGCSTHVLVTEDSVSMVSEAVTAGFKVGLLRVKRSDNFLKNILGYGAVRFDKLFEKMLERNLIIDLGQNPDYEKFLSTPEQKHSQNFNEAKSAAEFIIKNI